MKSRIPFVAAVVGALLIGGATTGGTFASWKDTSTLTGASITSAPNMRFTTSASPARQAFAQGGTAFVTATVTITDTSTNSPSANPKNLRQQYSVTSATSSLTGILVSVTSTCPSTAPTASTTGFTAGPFFTTQPATPAPTGTLCVAIAATNASQTGDGTVTLALKGTQVRPGGGSVNGWTSSNTYAVPITVTGAAPSAPSLTCSATMSDPNARTFTWNNVGTGVTYQVYRLAPGGSVFNTVGSPQTATTYTETTLAKDETSSFKVKSIKNGVESIFSSTVTISRNGNSANYNCSVTP